MTNNATYKPRTKKSTHKDNIQFYPVVEMFSKTVNDYFYLNNPQPTRSKALTIAKKYIKNLND